MQPKPTQVELLAPAGNFEKLEIAIHYGADAVYIAGKDYSLRNLTENFTIDQIKAAKALTHAHGVKLYVACNIYARNHEIKEIGKYLSQIGEIAPDAVILSDPGIFDLAREHIPEIPIHLSTQANTTNSATVRFWERLGVKRVNLARELSLAEIREITTQAKVETEVFIHGAMCISYSGRCLLSGFMANRDSNRGLCSHPCRWQYHVVEEMRPGEYMPIVEDQRGTYIFHSKDLCMIEHIPAMIEAGIHSFKIEGRMKGICHVASTVKVYREAIDRFYADPSAYSVSPVWIEELAAINHRNYCTGFFLGSPDAIAANLTNTKPASVKRFLGKILSIETDGGALTGVRNKIQKGQRVEILTPKGPAIQDEILNIKDHDGRSIDVAQPNQTVTLRLKSLNAPLDIIRSAE